MLYALCAAAFYAPNSMRSVSTRWGGGSGGGRSGGEGWPVPGQEFGDAASWVVGDAGEPIGEIVLRVEAVELGALDQRVEGRGAAAAGIGAGKQIIFAANSDTTQGPLGGIVVGRRPAVVEATHQARSSAPAYSGRPGASSDLRESWRRVLSAQAANASANGFDCSWRRCRRRSGGNPLMMFSTA